MGRDVAALLRKAKISIPAASCEGHNLHGSGPGPYVTFSCDDIKILGAISRKLIGTSWKIVLDDIAISKKAIHYT